MTLRASGILAAVAALLSLASLLHGVSREEATPLAGRLIKLPPSRIDALEFYRENERVVRLERGESQAWRVLRPSSPVAETADASVLEAFGALVRRATANPVERSAAAAGTDPFDSPVPPAQVVVHAEEENVSLYLGAVSEDGRWRYVSLLSDPKTVHAVEADLLRLFDSPPETYRTLDLFDLTSQPIQRFAIEPRGGAADEAAGGGGAERVLLERGATGGWVLREPVRWPAEEGAVEAFLQLCKVLRARSVEPLTGDVAALLERAGVTERSPAVVVETELGPQRVIFGGPAPGGGVYALREGRDQLYVVAPDLARVARDGAADDLRQRRLPLPLGGRVEVIEIQRDDQTLRMQERSDGWHATGARDWTVERAAVEFLAEAIQRQRIVRFVSERDHDAERYGLTAPDPRILLLDRSGRRMVGVDLAQPVAGGPVYARLDERPQILELDRAAAEALRQPFVFYRDRQVVNLDMKSIRRLEIRRPGGAVVYMHNLGFEYQMVEPETAPLSAAAQLDFVTLVRGLARLRCLEWLPPAVSAEGNFGLDPATYRVIVMMKLAAETDPPALDLRVGAAREIQRGPMERERQYYARLGEEGAIFMLPAAFVERLTRDYR